MSLISDIVGKILHPQKSQAQQPSPLQPTPEAEAAPVDVEKVFSDLASKRSETLNWRTSIVDLMKLLSLDSSLASRQQLAKELSYTGDANDSAKMNIWLHQKVMEKIAENGGKVPDDLKRH